MPVPNLLALVLCDDARVDPAGKVSLQGLFDSIWAAGIPCRHARLVVFWKARFEAPATLRTVIEGPSGAAVAMTDRVEVGQPGLAQAIHVIEHVEFPTPGQYLIRLLANDGQVGVTPLEVQVRQ